MISTTVTTETIESPRLRRLMEELHHSEAALDDFWQECATAGTPLIEEIEPGTGTRSALATFVWRAGSPLDNVVLIEWITPGDFPDKQMLHLPGTDIWYRTIRLRDDIRATYQFSPNDSLVPKREEINWDTRRRGWVNDPFNPVRLVEPEYLADPDLARYDSSILAMPEAWPQPWLEHQPGTPQGQVAAHRFASTILENTRDVWVYTPATYATGTESLPLLVLFDGERHESVLRVPLLLDNLIAAGAIPPLVAVMIGNVDRGEELPCSQAFAGMLAGELFPWVAAQYRVTSDATQRVTAGQSYGGLAAVFAALNHPDVFGSAISQSGSYWWKPDPMNLDTPRLPGDAPEYCWLSSWVAARPRAPVRIWMEAGRLEDRTFGDGIPGMVAVNRHFRDVLIARGYDVEYREFGGGHDYACWRHNLADGLMALLGDKND